MTGAVIPSPVYPGQMPPKQIVNGYSTNGWVNMPGYTGGTVSGVSANSCGALTAGVLQTVLNVTGPGVLEFLSVLNNNTTARTLRIQLIIDGVTVLDATSATLAVTGMVCIAGAFTWSSGSPSIALDAIPFNSSCVLNLASSLTESNPFWFQYVYRTV